MDFGRGKTVEVGLAYVAAHNAAKQALDASNADEMAKITGGLQLPPGLKLPF